MKADIRLAQVVLIKDLSHLIIFLRTLESHIALELIQ